MNKNMYEGKNAEKKVNESIFLIAVLLCGILVRCGFQSLAEYTTGDLIGYTAGNNYQLGGKLILDVHIAAARAGFRPDRAKEYANGDRRKGIEVKDAIYYNDVTRLNWVFAKVISEPIWDGSACVMTVQSLVKLVESSNIPEEFTIWTISYDRSIAMSDTILFYIGEYNTRTQAYRASNVIKSTTQRAYLADPLLSKTRSIDDIAPTVRQAAEKAKFDSDKAITLLEERQHANEISNVFSKGNVAKLNWVLVFAEVTSEPEIYNDGEDIRMQVRTLTAITEFGMPQEFVIYRSCDDPRYEEISKFDRVLFVVGMLDTTMTKGKIAYSAYVCDIVK